MKITTPMLSLVLLLAPVLAVQATGDPEAGKSKSATCAGCHGPDGNSPSAEFPKIAGQHASYIEKQLRDYKEGRRENAIMLGMVAGLSPQDMADLAAYYAAQTGTASPTDQKLALEGKGLHWGGDTHKNIAACMACHGPDARGNPMAKFPMLRGQHAAYTEKTLKAFRAGERNNDLNAMMRRVAARMSDKDIAAVAAYYSGVGAETPAAASAGDQAAARPAEAKAPEKAAAKAPEAASKSGDEVIKTACAACHATGAAGAPKLGDTAAWEPRAAKGLDTLLHNSINGIGAMPPRGGHMNLSDDEIRKAVVVMLERAGLTP